MGRCANVKGIAALLLLSALVATLPAWLILRVLVAPSIRRSVPVAPADSRRTSFLNSDKPLAELLLSGRRSISIYVEKSRYTLTVRANGNAIKSYPIVCGENPVDDKRMEGDASTPEGDFRIAIHHPNRWWTYYLGLDYPTAESKRKFESRKRSGEIPPTATIGGAIGIHGVPVGRDDLVPRGINWTAGCVSLRTADITEIYNVVKVGDRVRIVH